MEPTDQSHVKRKAARGKDATALDFLPDADAIERNPLPVYLRLTVHALGLALLLFVLWASFS